MGTLNLIFFIIFFALGSAFSIIELVFCYLEKEKYRKIFKCLASGMIIPCLVAINPLNYMIYVAAVFAVIGDFFLMIKIQGSRSKGLIVGGVFFALMHLSLIIVEIRLINNVITVPIYAYLVGFLLFLSFILCFVYFAKKIPTVFRVGAPLYASTILINIVFTILLAVYVSDLRYLIISGAYLVFLLSDSLIFISKVTHKIKRHHFWIMLTYLIALYTILITLAMILLYNPIVVWKKLD